MTHEQLIAKAREHAAVFERGSPFDARVADFDRVTVRETVVVRFDSSDRTTTSRFTWIEPPAIL